jgi:hypothetical protein
MKVKNFLLNKVLGVQECDLPTGRQAQRSLIIVMMLGKKINSYLSKTKKVLDGADEKHREVCGIFE